VAPLIGRSFRRPTYSGDVPATWETAAQEWTTYVRSGADAAYAWNGPAFFDDLLPPPGGLTIDVGCGEGRTTRELRARGYTVVGVDSASPLIRLAAEADSHSRYLVGDASNLPFDDGVAALVVAFMVLHDLRDLDGAVAEAARVLGEAGRFCFAIVHPVATAGDFVNDGSDSFAVDSYCIPFEVERPLGASTVMQFHRPLGAYSRALERAGFCIEAVREVPTLRRAAGRIPAFLHVRAAKRSHQLFSC
jgi:SAM-dependent methyltransferase